MQVNLASYTLYFTQAGFKVVCLPLKPANTTAHKRAAQENFK